MRFPTYDEVSIKIFITRGGELRRFQQHILLDPTRCGAFGKSRKNHGAVRGLSGFYGWREVTLPTDTQREASAPPSGCASRVRCRDGAKGGPPVVTTNSKSAPVLWNGKTR